MDWFLYGNGLHHERVKDLLRNVLDSCLKKMQLFNFYESLSILALSQSAVKIKKNVTCKSIILEKNNGKTIFFRIVHFCIISLRSKTRRKTM